MINEMVENEFWGNREEHHGEMDEWKSEKCENDEMEGGWNEDDVGWMIDEYDERGDSENGDVKCDVMKWDESENEKRREWYDE